MAMKNESLYLRQNIQVSPSLTVGMPGRISFHLRRPPGISPTGT